MDTQIDVLQLDLSSLASVRKFAEEFISKGWYVYDLFGEQNTVILIE